MEKGKMIDLKNEVEYNQESIVSKQIVKSNGGNVTLFAFDEEQALSEHTTPFDALLQVLDGDAEVIISGETFSISAGESIILPANVPHAVKALQRFKMLLTMVKEVKS